MANNGEFGHLKIPLRLEARARFTGRRPTPDQESTNIEHRAEHTARLNASATRVASVHAAELVRRTEAQLPTLPAGIPLLLRIEPDSDVDFLRTAFGFEIVSETEQGFVLVASEDINLEQLRGKIGKFANDEYGGGSAAKLYEIVDPETTAQRLERVLVEPLFSEWGDAIAQAEIVVDLSIECLGNFEVPPKPHQRNEETQAQYATRVARWQVRCVEIYDRWDALKAKRESEIIKLVEAYTGEVHSIVHQDSAIAELQDSFTVRVKVPGHALLDLATNYPFVFEISLPDDVVPWDNAEADGQPVEHGPLLAPLPGSPTVCVVDSGIEQNHPLLESAIRPELSRNFIPDTPATETSDYYAPDGHGTRVAGAILYPNGIPTPGPNVAECFLANARVLDPNCGLPTELFPPLLTEAIVDHYGVGDSRAKIFCQSINAKYPCRVAQMSAWAASIDKQSWVRDVLFVVSAGNLPQYTAASRLGFVDALINGDTYPDYLLRSGARIANPAQSMQALTVGSVSPSIFSNNAVKSLGVAHAPASYSTTGPGVWGAIKPEVVEVGGDFVFDTAHGFIPTTEESMALDLPRARLVSPGPMTARDAIGTSFAAPKVASLAARIEKLLPAASTQLIRALVVNSAVWPQCTNTIVDKANVLRLVGFGIPDSDRALDNNPYRVTLITPDERTIESRRVHVYAIPVPETIRAAAVESRIRISVCLSYVAQVRRTRRNARRYFSTWLDWQSNRLGESFDAFRSRCAILDDDEETHDDEGEAIPWEIGDQVNSGVRGVRRSRGSVQKDWATVRGYQLAQHLCIAVRAHQGWDRGPDAHARYALVVSFEAVDSDIEIYSPVRVALSELEVAVPVKSGL